MLSSSRLVKFQFTILPYQDYHSKPASASLLIPDKATGPPSDNGLDAQQFSLHYGLTEFQVEDQVQCKTVTVLKNYLYNMLYLY